MADVTPVEPIADAVLQGERRRPAMHAEGQCLLEQIAISLR